jgi:hypothetical protein
MILIAQLGLASGTTSGGFKKPTHIDCRTEWCALRLLLVLFQTIKVGLLRTAST